MTRRCSVVIITHNEGHWVADTVDAVLSTTPEDVEIVIVDDCSTDGSTGGLGTGRTRLVRSAEPLGISAGRNLGGGVATGDVLVFSDAHCLPQPGWLDPLLKALAEPDVGAVAPAIGNVTGDGVRGHGFTWRDWSLRMKWLRSADGCPIEVPFLCGCFLATRREVLDAVGGFDEGMYKWGSEDSELSIRMWLAGYRCVAVPSSDVLHLFRTSFPYDVDNSGVLHNILRQGLLHFGKPGIQRLVQYYSGRPAFPQAWTSVLDSDVAARRELLDRHRKYDAAWFGRRFDLEQVS